MAFAPALTALVLVGITLALVPSIAIGGKTYQEIVTAREIQRNTQVPQLSLSEVNRNVQSLIFTAIAQAPLDNDIQLIEQGWVRYEKAYQAFMADDDLVDETIRDNLTVSHAAAVKYQDQYARSLLPAVKQAVAAKPGSQSLERAKAETLGTYQSSMMGQIASHEAALQLASQRVDELVELQEADSDSALRQRLLVIVGITLLIIAAGIAIGLTVLRSITDRVRQLNEVATVELPRVLVEVQRAAAAGEDIPAMPESESQGTDELATAATAFNSVVATAVEMAAQQSRLRRSTSQMFINLGRRNHKLLSRTLTYITQLESDERDPSTLQNLFRLDHLTTRMRRHAESLLVLAGSPPLRTWSRPVPVADVLRAALSEIETYDRVDIKELEPVEVRGASVSDLAHLIAELLENATAFSPPQTRVRVLGRTDTDGYTIVVVDEGIGMSPDELAAANELINSADQAGLLGDSRMLGLGVVGRLAARHGFRVHLTASPVGGVVAWITLPSTALAPRRGTPEPEPMGALGSPAFNGSETAGMLPGPQGRQQPVAAQPDPVGPAMPSAHREEIEFGAANGSAPSVSPGNRPLRPAAPPTVPAPDAPHAPAARAAAPSTGPLQLPPPTLPGRPAHDLPAHDLPAREVPHREGPHHPGIGGSRGVPPVHAAAHAPVPGMPGPTEPISLPPTPDAAPVSGPISYRKPVTRPGEGGLTRRVRGAQLPDTGDATPPRPADAPQGQRSQRSAQSVRGALASFSAGRRTAAEVTIGNAAELKRAETRPPQPAPAPPPAAPADPITQPVISASTVRQPAAPGPILPRRVRGAQMPQTDLPVSAPAPERSAAEVRAALSNFVAGRRAAEHED